jgi:hypothetical protein
VLATIRGFFSDWRNISALFLVFLIISGLILAVTRKVRRHRREQKIRELMRKRIEPRLAGPLIGEGEKEGPSESGGEGFVMTKGKVTILKEGNADKIRRLLEVIDKTPDPKIRERAEQELRVCQALALRQKDRGRA